MHTPRFWAKPYRLDTMSLSELWRAYLQYPAIQTYLALSLTGGGLAWRWMESVVLAGLITAVVAVIYPLAWYLLHRFVLHGRFLYRSPYTARVWKRIHFDHHRDPHDLRVLFGALYTTLPTIVVVTAPAGYALGGAGGAAMAITAGLLITCIYEFCHCIQHLKYSPRRGWLKRIKRLHLQHHFHNEQYNYGITSFLPDKLLGTYHARPASIPRSPTVYNLGYTGEDVRRYPWVAEQTEDLEVERGAREGIDRRDPRQYSVL